MGHDKQDGPWQWLPWRWADSAQSPLPRVLHWWRSEQEPVLTLHSRQTHVWSPVAHRSNGPTCGEQQTLWEMPAVRARSEGHRAGDRAGGGDGLYWRVSVRRVSFSDRGLRTVWGRKELFICSVSHCLDGLFYPEGQRWSLSWVVVSGES